MKHLDREAVLLLFLEQAHKLDAADIGPRRGAYTLSVLLKERRYAALVLVRSSDYWRKRVHTYQHGLDLLIVYCHESCIPFAVLSLEDGHCYDPYVVARQPHPRNRYTSSILLGQLLCGVKDAYDALEQMPWQTKYRYLAQRNALLQRQRGRPLCF